MIGRGILTAEVKERAERYLNREFSQTELRLYPYLCDCALNSRRVERIKTTDEEQSIITRLEQEKRLRREYPSYMHPTREFFLFMQECLVDTYIEIADELSRHAQE